MRGFSLLFIFGVFVLLWKLALGAPDYTPEDPSARNTRSLYWRNYRFAQKPTPSPSPSLLDTFSLSFVGNFDFSRIIDGIRTIFSGIAKLVDLRLIRSMVDLLFNNLIPSSLTNQMSNEIFSIKEGRTPDYVNRKDEGEVMLRRAVTTFVGAVMNKQQCLELTACSMGEAAKNFAAKEVVFILADKVVPDNWRDPFDVMRSASKSIDPSCQDEFLCSSEIEEQDRV